jgi:hypothetical protein
VGKYYSVEIIILLFNFGATFLNELGAGKLNTDINTF